MRHTCIRLSFALVALMMADPSRAVAPPRFVVIVKPSTGETYFDPNTLIPPDSGWTLLEALDINDAGQIVGYGIKDGTNHAFLLQPVP